MSWRTYGNGPDGLLDRCKIREVGDTVPVHGAGDEGAVRRVQDPARRSERGSAGQWGGIYQSRSTWRHGLDASTKRRGQVGTHGELEDVRVAVLIAVVHESLKGGDAVEAGGRVDGARLGERAARAQDGKEEL